MITKNSENLHKQGVYYMKNIINNKVYIGSTTMSFLKRLQHHVNQLRNNKHKNQYLQNSWNKYGEENFEFGILEICQKENCLNKEQYYIDINLENSFNINPLASGTPNMSKETIIKRANTMKMKYAVGEIKSNFHKGHIPWNKGLKLGKTQYLKVPKRKTEKLIKLNQEKSIKYRENAPCINVFTLDNQYLGNWRSSVDIQENSLKNDFLLKQYIKSRFKTEMRRSKPYYYLASNHINNCANGNIKSYKGLIFKYSDAPSQSDL